MRPFRIVSAVFVLAGIGLSLVAFSEYVRAHSGDGNVFVVFVLQVAFGYAKLAAMAFGICAIAEVGAAVCESRDEAASHNRQLLEQAQTTAKHLWDKGESIENRLKPAEQVANLQLKTAKAKQAAQPPLPPKSP